MHYMSCHFRKGAASVQAAKAYLCITDDTEKAHYLRQFKSNLYSKNMAIISLQIAFNHCIHPMYYHSNNVDKLLLMDT